MSGPSSPDGSTQVVAVIGDPIAHSLTPLLHNTAFAAMGLDWVSVAFPVRAGDAPAAIEGMRALRLGGLSVTMPHKQAVVAEVDELTERARRLDAVNSIFWRDGLLIGDNTDGAGFLASLRRSANFEPAGKRALVLGAGGAARAVIAALADAGAAEIVVVARRPEAMGQAIVLAGSVGRAGGPQDVAAVDLVVNATPAGMADTPGQHEQPPLDPGLLSERHLVADLIYHPLRTAWLDGAAQRGARVVGGLGMLVHQAQAALTDWTGVEPPVEEMWKAAERALELRGTR
jgi:shikimate dehydrogenase